MTGFRARWIGPSAAVVVAAALAAEARHVAPLDTSWATLGGGCAIMLAIVACSAYRSRRDPALLFIGAGAWALGLGLLSYALDYTVMNNAPADGELVRRLRGLGTYEIFFGLLALALCLVGTVPWRDRRGRAPLRVRTVVVVVVVPSAVLAAAVLLVDARLGTMQARAILVATAAAAAVAAARATMRGGWLQWTGGGALALLLAALGGLASLASPSWNSHPPANGELAGFAWFTLLPFAVSVLLLLGVLALLRADASRLRRASDRAAEVMEGRAEIASIVAHDVRGPAGTIRSVAGSLRTSYQRLGDSERLEFVGMIEAESLRLLRVADQMSLGLKADAGTLPFNLEDRDVEGAVLQGLHEADAGPREVRTEFTAGLRARIDARWTAEAVRQGIENALRFSPADTPIDVRVREEATNALIEIEDRGPGIPPEMHEQVFEKFVRWRPRGYEDTPGSGLGLFVTRQIAREQGGDATIVSGTDGGTILQIRLPREGAERG